MLSHATNSKYLGALCIGVISTTGVLYYYFLCKANSKRASKIGQRHLSSLVGCFSNCVYLDYNATTPIFEEVHDKMEPFTCLLFGNPSSSHVYGAKTKNALTEARLHVWGLIVGSPTTVEKSKDLPPPTSVVFTACGSESDNGAIDMALFHFSGNATATNTQPHIVTSAIEHPAVLYYLQELESRGQITLTVVGVDGEGFVRASDIVESLQVNTALVTIMHSNNEVGTVQPIRAISDAIKLYNIAKGTDIVFHCDAAQSMGKVHVNVVDLGVDMLTIVGHKFGAPKGVAALYVRPGIRARPLLYGGGQEFGMRAGTENVIGIVGLGEACRLATAELCSTWIHMARLKCRFIKGLFNAFKAVPKEDGCVHFQFNGPKHMYDPGALWALSDKLSAMLEIGGNSSTAEGVSKEMVSLRNLYLQDQKLFDEIMSVQLPNTISVSFAGIRSAVLMPRIQQKVACSAGAACHSLDPSCGAGESQDKMSDVLVAMGVGESFGLGTLRISCGRHTTAADMDNAVLHISEAVGFMMRAAAAQPQK